ncbi:MAG TPA: hypothetical protein VFK52_03620 [Nocardioidaceae bacterium]|nr:hypothetical protein [Nocardioidaceae bacterium]
MTEQDIHDAQLGFRETIEGPAPSPVRPALLVAAAAVLALIIGFAASQSLVGDESSTPPVSDGSDTPELAEYLSGSDPTHELLAGVWRSGDLLVRFTTDGEIRVDNRGLLLTNPGVLGTYTIAGDLITVNGTAGVAGCAGEQWAMRASLPAPGMLHTVATLSGVEACTSPPNEQMTLQQVLPPNPELRAELEAAGQDSAAMTSLRGESQLYGDWVAQDGQYLLELSAGGGYFVAEAGGAVDRGQWALNDAGSQLRLTSTSASPTCSEGDRLVLGGLGHLRTAGSTIFRGTTQRNTCGAPWTPLAWMLLPSQR